MRQVDSLLYQLNSDSEGDEGSDIDFWEEEQEQDNFGDEEDAEGRAFKGESQEPAEASAEPQSHSGQGSQQPDKDVGKQHQTDADAPHAAVAAHSSEMVSEPEVAANLSSSAQRPAVRHPGLADSNAASSSQEWGVVATGTSQQATLLNDSEPIGTAEASNMPYDAASSGTRAAEQAGSAQQHLPGAATVNADTGSHRAGQGPAGMIA